MKMHVTIRMPYKSGVIITGENISLFEVLISNFRDWGMKWLWK